MGKRTRISEEYDSIAKKIKKLEKKLTRARHKERSPRRLSTSSTESSDSSSSSASSSPPQDTLNLEDVPIPSTSRGMFSNATDAPLPSTSAAAIAAELHSANTAVPPDTVIPTTSADVDVSSSPVLDQELLTILGEDPSRPKCYSDNIQPDLAIRLQHIAGSGLTKDTRKELIDKYLTPENCTLVEAPMLNPEVVAATTETTLKRDKSIEVRQKLRATAISGVARALTLLMSSEPKNTVAIQILVDTLKIMCDSQNNDSVVRRNLILNTLKKDLRDQLKATNIDKLLFGQSLAETIRAAKAITRSGADMKPAPLKLSTIKNKPQQKHLNWRVPPQNYRLKGTQRTKEPAYKNHHANASKQSSRPPRYRDRNHR